ncbi:sodium-dependent multivitamin transporter-like [Glandiceps talaboti]
MSSNDVTPFGVVDWVIFVAMLLLSTATGVYHAVVKGGQKTTSSYLVGGRSLSCVPIALSYFVSFTSSIAVMGFPAEIYVHGIQYSFVLVGYIFGTLLSAFIFIPFLRQFNFISVYEYLGYRFHYSIRIIAVLFGALSTTIYMSITITGPALAFQAVQGIDLWKTSLIIGIVCTFYTTLGGMKAVVWSDVFQFFVMTAAVASVFVLGLIEAGGVERVWNYSKEQGKLDIDFTLDPTIRLTYYTMLIYGVIHMFAHSVEQATAQRMLSAKSVREAQGSMLLSLPIKWLFYGMSFTTGLILFTYYNNNIGILQPGDNATFPPGMNYGDQLTEANYEPDYTSADQIIVYFISSKLGWIYGMQGLFISSLFAGAMRGIFIGMIFSLAYGLANSISSTLRFSTGYIPPRVLSVSFYYHLPLNVLSMILVGIVASEIVRLISVKERNRKVNPLLLVKFVRSKTAVEDYENYKKSLE